METRVSLRKDAQLQRVRALRAQSLEAKRKFQKWKNDQTRWTPSGSKPPSGIATPYRMQNCSHHFVFRKPIVQCWMSVAYAHDVHWSTGQPCHNLCRGEAMFLWYAGVAADGAMGLTRTRKGLLRSSYIGIRDGRKYRNPALHLQSGSQSNAHAWQSLSSKMLRADSSFFKHGIVISSL